MWPPPGSKGSANRDSVSRMRETMHDGARATRESILVDAATAAAALSISQRTFQNLRKRSDFPQNATVVLGPRCVRYRLEALHTFVLDLASRPQGDAKHVRRSGEFVQKKDQGPDPQSAAQDQDRVRGGAHCELRRCE